MLVARADLTFGHDCADVEGNRRDAFGHWFCGLGNRPFADGVASDSVPPTALVQRPSNHPAAEGYKSRGYDLQAPPECFDDILKNQKTLRINCRPGYWFHQLFPGCRALRLPTISVVL